MRWTIQAVGIESRPYIDDTKQLSHCQLCGYVVKRICLFHLALSRQTNYEKRGCIGIVTKKTALNLESYPNNRALGCRISNTVDLTFCRIFGAEPTNNAIVKIAKSYSKNGAFLMPT